MHRIVDTMVDHYRPEVEELEEWLDDLEQQVLEAPGKQLTSEILAVKRDIASAAADRRCRSATSSAGWPAASSISSTRSGPICSATSTTRSCTSPTTA